PDETEMLEATSPPRFGTVRRKETVVLTAKLTAILSHIGNRQQTSAESWRSISIWGGRRRTAADVRNAVFKNVGSGLRERCRISSRVAPLFVGLTAKIEAREAGDERGLVSSAVFKNVGSGLSE